MAIFDLAHRTVVLKIVYFGCALGGKTTNLITLHRLTDPEGRQTLVSIATKDDRTLFFDLLPLDLGQIGGLRVCVKVYTVPGQVHYEVTRRQVLAGADGVVLVVDSSPDKDKDNAWSLENLHRNLQLNALDAAEIPIVMQWNKRDVPDAVPVVKLEHDINPKGYPSHESVATTGVGVLETFETVIKASIQTAHTRSGKAEVPQQELEAIVTKALYNRSKPEPGTPAEDPVVFEHRFDAEAYREEWAEEGRDRTIIDEKTLLSEAVQTGMELAEKLDDLRDAREMGERRKAMMEGLGRLAPLLVDPKGVALPEGLMSILLQAAARAHGSVLLYKPSGMVMEEREVVPRGPDPLNRAAAPSVGTAAFRLCHGTQPRFIEDLATEVFFDHKPIGAENLASCFIAPVLCDGVRFGALVVYGSIDENPFDEAEREFWSLASLLIGLSLHWRGLRTKVSRSIRKGSRGGPSRSAAS